MPCCLIPLFLCNGCILVQIHCLNTCDKDYEYLSEVEGQTHSEYVTFSGTVRSCEMVLEREVHPKIETL